VGHRRDRRNDASTVRTLEQRATVRIVDCASDLRTCFAGAGRAHICQRRADVGHHRAIVAPSGCRRNDATTVRTLGQRATVRIVDCASVLRTCFAGAGRAHICQRQADVGHPRDPRGYRRTAVAASVTKCYCRDSDATGGALPNRVSRPKPSLQSLICEPVETRECCG
jgi:hypothetical protein